MLLTSQPYVNLSNNNGPPRIISEVRKPETFMVEPTRPRITSDLLVIFGNERRWCPRRVSIRGGQLFVGIACNNNNLTDNSSSSKRVPLRHMSLRAGPLPNSLSLIKGQNIILTLQTPNERAFDLWVKTIAIELIRQTPLEAVKYLDILSFANSWNNKRSNATISSSSNNNNTTTFDRQENYLPNSCTVCKEPSADTAARRVTPQQHQQETDVNRNNVKIIETPCCQTNNNNNNNSNQKICVELLLKRCQNVENYVSVKEKLVLFESLCKLGRVRSSEDVSLRGTTALSATTTANKRARSLHDLSNCSIVSNGVREICKYFERKTGEIGAEAKKNANKRLIYSDSSLHKKVSVST